MHFITSGAVPTCCFVMVCPSIVSVYSKPKFFTEKVPYEPVRVHRLCAAFLNTDVYEAQSSPEKAKKVRVLVGKPGKCTKEPNANSSPG